MHPVTQTTSRDSQAVSMKDGRSGEIFTLNLFLKHCSRTMTENTGPTRDPVSKNRHGKEQTTAEDWRTLERTPG